jgi:riboflavin synthase
MFTGLVEQLGEVASVVAKPPGALLVVQAGICAEGASIGDSIAINGCCLTVIEVAGERLSFEAGPETLARTNLGRLKAGAAVNLERSVKVGQRLGGHFVTGHIDGLGRLVERIDQAEWSTFSFVAPPALMRQMASKGSIAIDGVSLTLVDVTSERFSVALIPHTLRVTTLGRLSPGDEVNLETDVLAKYVERQLGFGNPLS